MSKSKKSISESDLPIVDETLASDVSSLISDKEELLPQEDVPVPELKETPEEQITETVVEEIKVEDKHPEKTCEKSEKVVKTDTAIAKTATGFLHGGSIYRGMI